MVQAATKKADAPVGSAEMMRGAIDMLPLVEADANDAERLTHLTDRVVGEFRRIGLNTMLTPRELGGAQLSYSDAMHIVERMAHADGATGWCLMVQCVMGGSMGSFLPEEGARTVFGKGADVIGAGNGVPRGAAREVDGGYMIKGHWSYGSGIQHAEWIHSGCFIMDGDKMRMTPDGAPDIVLCQHPRSTITLKGNWDVLGLRGTGSYDYTLNEPELFVPHHMTYKFNGGTPVRGGVQYSAGLVTITSWGHTSWALGVGRRTLDELAKLALSRGDAFGKLCDSPTFKLKFAEAEAKFRAAQALIYRTWEGIDENYAQGRPASLEQLTMVKLGMRYLHDVLSEVSTFAHISSRGASLRSSTLQRCYRDIHAGTQHILMADEIVQECGRALMGNVGESAQWTMFGVKG
jgi:alkylation response protein AidB-like acyl-CoA dehydrogenase